MLLALALLLAWEIGARTLGAAVLRAAARPCWRGSASWPQSGKLVHRHRRDAAGVGARLRHRLRRRRAAAVPAAALAAR